MAATVVPTTAPSRRRRVIPALVAGAIAAAVVTQRHSLLTAAGRAVSIPPELIVVALSLEVLSFAATAELQRRLLSGAGVRARWTTLLALGWASSAVSAALPAGGAASTVYSYRQLTRRGTPPSVAGWLLVASSALSAAALALLVVVGAQLRGLLSTCTAGDIAELTALVGMVATGVGLVAWVSARPGCLAAVQRRVRRTAALLTRRRPHKEQPTLAPIGLPIGGWAAATFLAIFNWAADGAVLAVSVASVGGRLRLSTIVLAYGVSQLATSLPVLPGSLGIAEGSLVVALVCSGVRAPEALAATLVYRVVTFWLQLVPGWVAWARLRHVRPFAQAAAVARGPRPVRLDVTLA